MKDFGIAFSPCFKSTFCVLFSDVLVLYSLKMYHQYTLCFMLLNIQVWTTCSERLMDKLTTTVFYVLMWSNNTSDLGYQIQYLKSCFVLYFTSLQLWIIYGQEIELIIRQHLLVSTWFSNWNTVSTFISKFGF